MALARFALKSLQQRALASSYSASFLGQGVNERSVSGVQRQRSGDEIVRRFTAAAGDKVAGETSDHRKEVAVSEGRDKKSRLFPRRNRKRWFWRNKDRDFTPAHYGTCVFALSLSLSLCLFKPKCFTDLVYVNARSL